MNRPVVRGTVLVAVLCAALLPAVPAGAVTCAKAGPVYAQRPWSQELLGTDRVAPFARGGGVTVAVLDSGVDAGHPQLAGRVSAGYNAVTRSGAANRDCLGHGTAVAGIIAAQARSGTGVAGLAPGATILPVKVVNDTGYITPVVEAAALARGIDWASTRAQVIVVPVAVYADNAALRAAVTRAVDRSVLVVAAVGDRGGENDGNPRSYPASYDGVLGVGAIGPDTGVWGNSQHGGYVDVVAPGVDLIVLAARRGHVTGASGTGLAAAYVAATAALVRAKGSGSASVSRVLLATATPAAAGAYYGRGVINPYAAVNEERAGASPVALPALAAPRAATESPWARSREIALWGVAIAVAVAFVALILGLTLPRGRRRRWRAVEAAPPRENPTDLEPAAPVLLFEER